MNSSLDYSRGFRRVIAPASNRAADVRRKTAEEFPLGGLLSNKLLNALPDEDLKRLIPHLKPARFSAGENIHEIGASIRWVYFPEDCVVSRLGILEDGGTFEVGMIGRDGMVGFAALLGSAAPLEFTQASIAGSALKMSYPMLAQEFDRGGALARLLLGYTGDYIAQVSRRAVCGVRHQVKQRLVNWLLMIHDRLATDDLELTQDFIAQRLGVRRSGITVAAHELQAEGLIGYTRGHIRILDRRRLEAVACECYATLGSAHDQLSHR